jgi:hypothetical protein
LFLTALFVAAIAFLGLGGWLFFKRRESSYQRARGRRRGVVAAGFGLLAAFSGAALYSAEAAEQAKNQIAADAGSFSSIRRYLAAHSLGFASDGEYAAHLDRQRATMAQAVEPKKVDAVESFRNQAMSARNAERDRVIANGAADRIKQEAAVLRCRNNAECFARQNMARADLACGRPVADLSESYADWVNKEEEPRFGRFQIKNLDAGIVTYIGDKIQFPNGTGGMVNQIYECDFDGEKDRVVGVRARPGRLPR